MEAISVISVLILLISLGILLRLAEKIEDENRMLESGLEAARMYNDIVSERMRQIRRFRHDAAGLLQAIDSYAPDTISAHSSDTDGQPDGGDRADMVNSVRMPILDAVIELKKRQCISEAIVFESPEFIESLIASSRDIDETDLCLLIQNLLDNAYEANLRVSDRSKRWMTLRVEAAQPDDALVITVSNRIEEGEKISFLTRKSSPELHGIGLRIVEEIIRKYDGTKTVDIDSSSHVISIRITI